MSNNTAFPNDPASDLSDAQTVVLAVSTIPMALLSSAASSLIIYMVLYKKKRNGMDSLGRILIGMSVCDIIASTQTCLQAFLAPQDASQRITSLGNSTSCNTLGFLWQFSYACFCYNGLLSFYYLVTIRYGWRDGKFQKYEWYLHGLCIGYPLVTASFGSVFKWYDVNEIGFGCWVNNYPRNCGDEPHETGENCIAEEIAWVIGGIPVLLLITIIIANNIFIYRYVRWTLFRSRRHSVVNLDSQARRMRQVAIQCFLYVLAFWCTTIPSIIIRNLEARGFSADSESSIFPILLLQSIAVPSTGMWNFMVYIRPQYMKCREDFPNESRWWAFRRAAFGSIVNPVSISNFNQPTTQFSQPTLSHLAPQESFVRSKTQTNKGEQCEEQNHRLTINGNESGVTVIDDDAGGDREWRLNLQNELQQLESSASDEKTSSTESDENNKPLEEIPST